MRKNIIILIGALILSCSSGKNTIDLGYEDYSKNNPLLLLGANSTIRASDITLDVVDPSKAIYTVKKAVTIYDKEDKDLATVVLDYGEFKTINYLKANIISKNGQVVRSYSIKDAQDYSTAWGSTFLSDVRLKILELPYSTFPYTIEVEYQQTYTGLLNLPDWRPQVLGQSVESARFTLIDRQNSGVRFYNKNIDIEPTESTTVNGKSYSWNIAMKLPVKKEPYGPSSSDLLPHILVAPGTFEMDNSKGNASTWKNFGLWYYELGKDTRELPDEAKAEINTLIAGVDTEEEKVKILFDYLQQKSRYVSIQLGIGGWKPFSAEYVFNNSYGDCKALTNYMQAALEFVGINAESVLIKNGTNEAGMEVDFPSNQFNHVIIRVTLENGEEIWLECTSKYLPPNHIGSGNAGKYALLITERGGEVIKTPENVFEDNKTERYWQFVINELGVTEVNGRIKSEGILQDDLLYQILPVSEKERLDWLQETFEVDDSNVLEYDFSKISENDDYASYSFKAQLKNYVQTSSKRLYIPVNKMNRWRFSISEDEKRQQPLLLPYAFVESDSIIIETPVGFSIEAAPKDVEYKHSFGEFKATFEVKSDGEIVYKRYFALQEKTIEAEKYEGIQDFFQKVRAADNQQLVLVKKEG
tara:strand:+ start:27113 stop:29038 length:1926 start_codon:yes stop_codon:yes gene_type:complete